MKPKNDTLKNDEQPRSFIQQNWLLLANTVHHHRNWGFCVDISSLLASLSANTRCASMVATYQ